MKTTIELPDQLFRRAKAYAAVRAISLRELFTDAVERRLRADDKRARPAWKELHGGLKSLRRETRKIGELVEAEFEGIDAEDSE